MPRTKDDAKRERVEFRTTKQGLARLDVVADREHVPRANLVGRELAHITESSEPLSFMSQVKLFVLQQRHEAAEVHAEHLQIELDDLRHQLQEADAGSVRSRIEKRRAAVDEALARARLRAAQLAREMSHLQSPVPRAPTRVQALAFLPVLALTTMGAFTIILLVVGLLVAIVVGGVLLLRRYAKKTSAFREDFQVRARAVARAAVNPDAAPTLEELARMDKGLSTNTAEVLLRFWEDAGVLRHRLQVMLDRPGNGLDNLRDDVEGMELVYTDERGDTQLVRVIVATQAEWDTLPVEHQLHFLSAKAKRNVPSDIMLHASRTPPALAEPEDDEPAPEPVSAAAPAAPAKKKRGRPTNLERAARAAASAPGIFPNQPPTRDGHGGTNGDGGAAPAGGGAQ